MPRPFSKARDLKRRAGTRPPYDRVLIVCEGSKTESQYFDEIRQKERLPNAHVAIVPSDGHTSPIQIVERAINIFEKTPEYERVYAVFDRDQHHSYAAAVYKSVATRLKNREKERVLFEPAISIPAFELWILLHYRDLVAFTDRNDILTKLLVHLPDYNKGMKGLFDRISEGASPSEGLSAAIRRAEKLKEKHGRLPGTEPYTDVHELVDYLLHMKRKAVPEDLAGGGGTP